MTYTPFERACKVLSDCSAHLVCLNTFIIQLSMYPLAWGWPITLALLDTLGCSPDHDLWLLLVPLWRDGGGCCCAHRCIHVRVCGVLGDVLAGATSYYVVDLVVDSLSIFTRGRVIRAAAPCEAAYIAALQSHVDTERRAFTDVGVYLQPTRVLGSCIGISSSYAAALHGDPSDLGFTTAFIGKCGPTRVCRCDARGCSAALFQPRKNAWRKGGLSHGGKHAITQ